MSTEEEDQALGRLVRDYREARAQHDILYLEISRIGGLLVTLGTFMQDHMTAAAAGAIQQQALSEKIDFSKLAVMLAEFDALADKLAQYNQRLGQHLPSPPGS